MRVVGWIFVILGTVWLIGRGLPFGLALGETVDWVFLPSVLAVATLPSILLLLLGVYLVRRGSRRNAEGARGRLEQIEAAMDRLVRDHPVVSTRDELYLYISSYLPNHTEREDRYCKQYLDERINRGYLRWDDER